MSRSGALHVISAIEAAAAGGGPGRPARRAAADRACAAGRPGGGVLSRVRRMLAAAPRSDGGAHGGAGRDRPQRGAAGLSTRPPGTPRAAAGGRGQTPGAGQADGATPKAAAAGGLRPRLTVRTCVPAEYFRLSLGPHAAATSRRCSASLTRIILLMNVSGSGSARWKVTRSADPAGRAAASQHGPRPLSAPRLTPGKMDERHSDPAWVQEHTSQRLVSQTTPGAPVWRHIHRSVAWVGCRASIVQTPSSCMVRTISVRSISTDRCTPRSPPAIRP
jgi:hypothetical protein